MVKGLVGTLIQKCLKWNVLIFFISKTPSEDFSTICFLSFNNSAWTHCSSPFLSAYLSLSSHSHLISLFCFAEERDSFRETFVGGFFGLSSSSAAEKYFCRLQFAAWFGMVEEPRYMRSWGCGARRRQTSSQQNHSTSNPSITRHLLG